MWMCLLCLLWYERDFQGGVPGALKRLKVSGSGSLLNLPQTLAPFKDNKSNLFLVDSFSKKF